MTFIPSCAVPPALHQGSIGGGCCSIRVPLGTGVLAYWRLAKELKRCRLAGALRALLACAFSDAQHRLPHASDRGFGATARKFRGQWPVIYYNCANSICSLLADTSPIAQPPYLCESRLCLYILVPSRAALWGMNALTRNRTCSHAQNEARWEDGRTK